MSIDSCDIATAMACQPFICFSPSWSKYSHAYFYKYGWCARQVALPSPRLWSTSCCCCCYSWHHPFSRPHRRAALPQQNLHNPTDASLPITLCHNPLRLLTDNRHGRQQRVQAIQRFWRLVRKCCSEPASLFSSGVATCLGASPPHHHLPPWWWNFGAARRSAPRPHLPVWHPSSALSLVGWSRDALWLVESDVRPVTSNLAGLLVGPAAALCSPLLLHAKYTQGSGSGSNGFGWHMTWHNTSVNSGEIFCHDSNGAELHT